jgi:hypothetical protein
MNTIFNSKERKGRDTKRWYAVCKTVVDKILDIGKAVHIAVLDLKGQHDGAHAKDRKALELAYGSVA